MKVTYNWLKDFVEIKITPEALADKLTMAGLEVVSLGPSEGDFVFEIEITSNRPDWLSVAGIAREVAAITGQRLKWPYRTAAIIKKKNTDGLALKIADLKDCPLYTAKIIHGVQVGPSPVWLKERLERVACRSVNNIVDITNYVLFECGHPLHAFDLKKLSCGNILVRRAHKDEKIVTLDGLTRVLDPGILVISGKEKAVAIAGIMGGQETQVTADTQDILLEAAAFNPALIRRARQQLSVQTESAYRFERGVDPQMAGVASRRAAQLIRKIAGGAQVVAQAAIGRADGKKKTVVLDIPQVNQVLGFKPAAAEIKRILTKLEFRVKQKTKESFLIEPPSWRRDVQGPVDLIEELARISGYDRMPTTLPRMAPQVRANKDKEFIGLTKSVLVGLGLNEVITYSLVDPASFGSWTGHPAQPPAEIRNPLSKEQAALRLSLAPSLARCVAYNLNQRQDAVNIFEISPAFSRCADSVREELMLCIALCGTKSRLSAQGRVTEEQGLLHLKGIVETLLLRLGIKDYAFRIWQDSHGASVFLRDKKIGIMQMLPRGILGELDIKNKEVAIAEFSLEQVFSSASLKRKFVPLPKYPYIVRDASFVIKDGVSVTELIEAMRKEAGPFLAQVEVTDYYKGRQIPEGSKGLTLSCFYLSGERTLTETEINPRHAAVLKVLADGFGAQARDKA